LKGSTGDLLDAEKHANSLANFISNCETPMAVGIQGGWGTGKTSLMKMIEEKLDSDCIKVWINTWQYAQVYDKDKLPLWVIAGLMRKLRDQLSILDKASGIGKRLLGTAIDGILKQVLKLDTSLNEVLQGEETKLDFSTIVESIHDNFVKAIDSINAENVAKRVIFFVDDLDRISPPVAVAILEAIKNFIDGPKCVFVLAIDFEVVSRGIGDRQGVDGREFFDKIIQVPYHLRPDTYNFESYIAQHLARVDGSSVEVFGNFEIEPVVGLITQMNPRTIKRALNLYSILSDLSQSARGEALTVNGKLLVFMFTCLQVSPLYRRVYSVLCQSQAPELVLIDIVGVERYRAGYAIASQPRDNTLKMWARERAEIVGHKDEVEANLSDIASFMLGLIDVNGDGEIGQDEVKLFRELLKVSALTSVEQEGQRQRNRTVSFVELREAGLLPADGDVKLLIGEGSQIKKVYMLFEGKQYKVKPSRAGGGKGPTTSLRAFTSEYLGLNYTPSDYTDYWFVEETGECLSDLIAQWRQRKGI